MNLLLVDTAGPVVGVAAFAGPHLAYAADLRVAAGTEVWLGEHLERALVALPGLDRVAVAVGPGAFTGIRVGVAAALGLAFARGIEVAPISSLALRATLISGEARVLALLDARKGKLYAGWFDTRGEVPLPLAPEVDANPTDAVAGAPGWAVGEGALAYAAEVAAAGHRVASEPGMSPVVKGRILAATTPTRSPEKVGLRYLREPDARPSRV